MQVELHVQRGPLVDRASLKAYAGRALPLEHPALVKILEVGLDDSGCGVLVTPAASGPSLELHRIASPLIDAATACSFALSLAEALDYLHRMQFRGGMSLSWGASVRAIQGGDGGWHLAVMPPTPAQGAMVSTPGGFSGVARYGAPELRSPWRRSSVSCSRANIAGPPIFARISPVSWWSSWPAPCSSSRTPVPRSRNSPRR
jgi:hypothetical protein